MLTTLAGMAARVVLIADTPHQALDPPTCLSAHPSNLLACATPRSQAVVDRHLAGERHAAITSGAAFIDPTEWLCPTVPCPPVIGDLLVYRDAGHMTATFSRALAPYLGAAIGRVP
jgi:hypothetical protein